MKNIFKIFISDVKRIFQNVVAVVVIMGLCVIPCLYAWFNIFSNWDPYGESSTSNLKVAVVSEDEGVTVAGISVNIGSSVVEALQENKVMGWVFTETSDEAVDGVYSGEYYAALVIPDDFTEEMISFLGGQIEHPDIIYYENEKKNAIAPKITSKAKTSVQEQVNASFVSTLAEAMMQVGDAVAGNDVDGGSLADTITQRLNDVSGDLQSYINILNSFASILNSAQSIVATSQVMLPGLDSMVSTGQDTVNSIANVAKAPLSVTAKDVTIEQGQEAALDGTVKGLVGKDTAKVTYAVLGTDGKAVQSTKNLAVGTYKIRATVEDQKNYDVTSVVDGTLTVNAVAATGVTVNTTALKINVGESRQVSATVAPANAADKNVTWSSDNTAVAKVTSDGVVYAIAEGTANVTAKTANGKTATIAVTVSTVKADSVKLNASKVTLTSIGASKTVKATVNPTNTTDKTVTWSSSNKKVATVDKNGKIVAKGNGKATITVKTANGKKATVKVTVKQATKKVVLKVGKKVVTGKTYTLKKGKKATVKATVTDAKGKKVTSGNQKITWTTSNKKVATISKSGKITAKKAGTVKITAKTADGKKVTFKVKVK